MNDIINKMKETLNSDETLTTEQIKALRDFIQSWGDNLERIDNDIKKL
jgi:hypothetical protein